MQSSTRNRLGACVLGLMVATATSAQSPVPGDGDSGSGAHAFDWETGTWTTRLRRLAKPLSGSGEWVEYTGTTVVTRVLDGRANLAELRVEGPAGRIHGASLRLYDPQARQWSLNYANARDGRLSRPLFGGFRNGRGEFHGQDELGGRAILVRFVISDITPDSARFEQAFSEDGGRTWETNWIAVDTRVATEVINPRAAAPSARAARTPNIP